MMLGDMHAAALLIDPRTVPTRMSSARRLVRMRTACGSAGMSGPTIRPGSPARNSRKGPSASQPEPGRDGSDDVTAP